MKIMIVCFNEDRKIECGLQSRQLHKRGILIVGEDEE